MLIDKTEVEYRFKKSVESYDENAHAQKMIIQRLMVLLNAYSPLACGQILEAGCGTGLLTRQLKEKYTGCELFVNDLVDAMCSKTAGRCHLSPKHCIVGDIEQVAIEGRFELIVSASTFQWLVHPAQTFTRLADHLYQGGQLVFSTFGKDNCKELRILTGNGLVYYSIEEMKDLLSPCFEVIHAEENHYVLEFDNPLEVLRHIKKTGVNAVNVQQNWTRGKLEDFVYEYAKRFQVKGHYPLTYHPQYFICKKKAL